MKIANNAKAEADKQKGFDSSATATNGSVTSSEAAPNGVTQATATPAAVELKPDASQNGHGEKDSHPANLSNGDMNGPAEAV